MANFSDNKHSKMAVNPEREKALADYRKKLMEHKEVDARLKDLRGQLKDLTNQYDKSENDLKALQSVGQIVGEVLRQLTEEKFIVKVILWETYCRKRIKFSFLGNQRSSLCCRLQKTAGEVKAETRDQGRPGHDHPHHHEVSPQGGGPLGVQHVT